MTRRGGSGASIRQSRVYRDAKSMIEALPSDHDLFESGRFLRIVDARFGILPSSGWPKTVFKLFREACVKVARGEWRGVPRKLVAEVKQMMTGEMDDKNGKRVRVDAETLARLASLFIAAHGIKTGAMTTHVTFKDDVK